MPEEEHMITFMHTVFGIKKTEGYCVPLQAIALILSLRQNIVVINHGCAPI